MNTKKIVWYIGVVAVLIGVGQVVATEHSLYFTVWWSDIIMHFLGGFWIGLIALWFYKAFKGENASSKQGYFIALAVTIVVGMLWELFEILMGVTLMQANYEIDTVVDLIMDIVGAVVATHFVFRKIIVNHHPIETNV